MKTVNKDTNWLPNLLNDFFYEERLDRHGNNYETFSIPPVNIIENLPNFVVEVAVPGLHKEAFNIEVEENALRISAQKPEKAEDTTEENSTRYQRREFAVNNFERSFELPENIDLDKIEANYENGILRVTLPKKEEKKALKRMVEIS